jgi:uncharacterized protein (DUF2336 family)
MKIIFTKEDIEKINKNPTDATKIGLVDKLMFAFNAELDHKEKLLAKDIVRLLAADISISIRETISKKFGHSEKLPKDIALKLASDLEDIVAIPVIERSSLLTEDDLIKILDKANINRQHAVARRSNLTEKICTHISEKAPAEVLETLVQNKFTPLTKEQTEKILLNHKENDKLLRAMIQFKRVDIELAHELLTKVSEDMRKILIVEYDIPSSVVNNLIHDSKEWVVLSMIRAHNDGNLDNTLADQVIARLKKDGELSFSLLIKALSLGNISFLERSWSQLADLPLENIKKLLWEVAPEQGFKGLYEKSKFPVAMQEAFWSFLRMVKKLNLTFCSENSPDLIYQNLLELEKLKKIKNLEHLATIVTHTIKKVK